jgi:hypothetical protein
MPDTLLFNADLVTLNDQDTTEEAPGASSVLIRGDRIVAVGEHEALRESARGEPEAIDLQGKTLIPGFNDNHVHAIIFGDHESVPDLGGLNEQEIVNRVLEHYRDVKPGRLVVAYGWDYTHCKNPHKELLDRAFPNNPVVLPQFSGHGQWVNSRALHELGITGDTPDPERGHILRDEAGEPTGILREMSMNALMSRWFRRINNRRAPARERLQSAFAQFRRFGITSIQDNTWYPKAVGAFRRALRRGELTCRVSCWSFGEDAKAAKKLRRQRFVPPWITRGPDKFFLDGTYSTRTAWLTEAYVGEPDNRGAGRSAEEIVSTLEPSVAARRQVACHAIGDRAVQEYVTAVERLAERYSWVPELRLRIEHGQIIRPEDVERIKALGMVVCAQPSALATPEKDAELLGRERARRSYPYRSLLDGGVPLSFGSDIPGERTCDPIVSMDFVVNREGPEAITPEEALRCFTRGSAYAEFAEDEKGAIAPGFFADLTVLSQNPLKVDTKALRDTRVEMTIVGGRIVYDQRDR